MIEALGTLHLTFQIADDITCIFLNVSRGIFETIEIAEIESCEGTEATHLHREGGNIRIVTDIEGLQCCERADADGHLSELVVREVEFLYGGSGDIGGQALQLVVSKGNGNECRRPLRHVGDLGDPVV